MSGGVLNSRPELCNKNMPFISTSYDYDALIDEYGIIRQPIWSHLKDFHTAIKLCEEALIATEINISWSKSRIYYSNLRLLLQDRNCMLRFPCQHRHIQCNGNL
ncbi:Beta-galactosidase 8 [Trifolium repens]|nr:Beta-galactosidase 8 [Trifolium repens]